MAAAGLGIFHNGKAMLQTQLITDPAQSPGGTPEVAEFPGTFQIYRTHDDVIMDMVLIYVRADRSEEHTSELQSRFDLVCRLLLEKKKIHRQLTHRHSS